MSDQEKLIDLDTIKCKIEAEVKKMRAITQWLIGITIPILLLLVIAITRIDGKQSDNETRITKINNDYAPLIVIQDIMENNDHLLNIIQSIPRTTIDDQRYLNAVKSRDEFQRKALQRASTVKRSGNLQ